MLLILGVHGYMLLILGGLWIDAINRWMLFRILFTICSPFFILSHWVRSWAGGGCPFKGARGPIEIVTCATPNPKPACIYNGVNGSFTMWAL